MTVITFMILPTFGRLQAGKNKKSKKHRPGDGVFACDVGKDIGCLYAMMFQSSILPSVETVTTCHWINFPLRCNAVFADCSSPPQHGTPMHTMVTPLISSLRMI
jgi:hypothetical protein